MLEELAALHAMPAKILEHRVLAKLKGTYIDALPPLVNPRTGRLHTSFNQAVAATGRLSSSDPNLQNIPIRTEVGRRIRAAFVAEPGHLLVSADYSQIELRILAHFSEDPVLLDAFRIGRRHPPAHGGRGVRRPAGVGDAEQRRIAKAINYGLVSARPTSAWRSCSASRAPRRRPTSQSYFERYAGVRATWTQPSPRRAPTGEVVDAARAPPPDAGARSHARAGRDYAERIARNTPDPGHGRRPPQAGDDPVDAGDRDRAPPPARRACC